MMKKILLNTIRKFGYELKRVTPAAPKKAPPPAYESMSAGLARSKGRGVNPGTVIDVGAAQGKWSQRAMTVWGKSHYVLFEPLAEREQELDALAAGSGKVHIVKAGAGSERKKVDFFVTGDLDGSGVADNGTNAEKRKISITTIDHEISRLNLPGPYLLKLDTHGYEVPIFEGAGRVLEQTELIIVECYGFYIAEGSLLFWQMCQYLEGKGFRLVDIVELYGRPGDQAFWQCDAFFIPKNHPVFGKNTYH